MRSRIVSRPPSCWRLTRSGPPSSSASSSRRRSSSISACQSLRDAPSIAPCVPIPASVHGDEDAVARLAVERLGAMPLAPRVLDEEHFAGADAARLAVTRGDLYARVEIDDVLPPRGRMPVEVVVGRHLAEDDSRGGEARRQPARAGRFRGGGFHVLEGRLAVLVGGEPVGLHGTPACGVRRAGGGREERRGRALPPPKPE